MPFCLPEKVLERCQYYRQRHPFIYHKIRIGCMIVPLLSSKDVDDIFDSHLISIVLTFCFISANNLADVDLIIVFASSYTSLGIMMALSI